jgi:hypothetical protein
MKFDEINDPKGLCRDVTHIGHFGNGDIEIAVSSLDQIEDVMDLVRQSLQRISGSKMLITITCATTRIPSHKSSGITRSSSSPMGIRAGSAA